MPGETVSVEVFVGVDVVGGSRESSTVISLMDESVDLGLGLDKIAVVSWLCPDEADGPCFEGVQQSISVDMKRLTIGGTEGLAIYIVKKTTSSSRMHNDRDGETRRIHSVDRLVHEVVVLVMRQRRMLHSVYNGGTLPIISAKVRTKLILMHATTPCQL